MRSCHFTIKVNYHTAMIIPHFDKDISQFTAQGMDLSFPIKLSAFIEKPGACIFGASDN